MFELGQKWRIYWLFKSADVTRKINGLFFYLRKIPFIGKGISVSIYRNYEIKKILFVIMTFFGVLMKFAVKFLWVGINLAVISLLSNLLNLQGEVVESGLALWLLTVPLLVGAFDGFGERLSQQDADFIANFQVSNRYFVQSRMLVETIYDGLCSLPAMLFFGAVVGRPLLVPLVSLFCYLASLFLFYYLGRLISLFSKRLRMACSCLGYLLIVGLIGFVFWQDGFSQLFQWCFSWQGLIISFLAMCVSSWLLFNYQGEERYSYWLIERSAGQLEAMATAKKNSNAYLGEGLKMQKDLKLVTGEQSHLTGNQYLNSLLFSRYRPTLTRQLKWRLLGITAVSLVIVGISLLKSFPLMSEKEVISLLPAFFFVMYFLTFGKKVVQMVFINCDSSMLFYPFYREPKTILQGFYYRFWKTFYYNGILSLAMFLAIFLINSVNGFFLSLSFFGILGFLLLSLSLLFSFHELFIYYILQPFSSDLEVINPVYKVVAGVLYGVAYLNMQLRSMGASYVILVSILSLIYVAVGLLIVWRVAPKTFRFKG